MGSLISSAFIPFACMSRSKACVCASAAQTVDSRSLAAARGRMAWRRGAGASAEPAGLGLHGSLRQPAGSRPRPESAACTRCTRRRPDELLGCSEDGCLPPELSHDWIFGMIQAHHNPNPTAVPQPQPLRREAAPRRKPEPEPHPKPGQVLLLMGGYGYLLFYASNLLSEGDA